MLFYSTHNGPRLTYILELVSSEIFNEPFTLVSDKDVFISSSGNKINYSEQRLTPEELYVRPHGLLFETGIREVPIYRFDYSGKPAFFETSGDFPFDIFAAAFYLLSRYEEYLPFQPDKYGRFPHEASLAYKENFLHLPLVNYWLEDFKKALRAKFPNLSFRMKDFKFIPSYDIDIAYSYKYKGLKRNLGGFYNSVLKREWKYFLDRWDVLFNKKKDPFDSYEWLDSLHLYCRTRAYYFFLLAKNQVGVDKNISPDKHAIQSLIAYHAKGYTVGIHPSWQSGDEQAVLMEELDKLEKIIGSPVKYSRQHYLRMSLPQTYRRLIDVGIEKDFSMGYGSSNGFRASMASSFYWFDLKAEKKSELMLFPFCFMDSTAFYEQKLTPKAAFAELMEYYNKIKQINGLMVTIWHNNFFGTDTMFAGWKEVYEVFLKDQFYWDM
ncbi:MAG TPA: polysaccharide deacetylase family protein [Puia sp.]|nr:polysaccharide deacetylase family protein [Puia sp.]